MAGLPPLRAVLPSFLHAHSLAPSSRLAVALSGGPDSLALAGLLAHWSSTGAEAVHPVALIVDHGLRPESGVEAAHVADQARRLRLDVRILHIDWRGRVPAPGAKLEAARRERYRLLSSACQEAGCTALLLGHHAGVRVCAVVCGGGRRGAVCGLAGWARGEPGWGSRSGAIAERGASSGQDEMG